MIGRRGERGSGISVLAARYDDDDLKISVHNVNYQVNLFEYLSFPKRFSIFCRLYTSTHMYKHTCTHTQT